MNSLHHPFLTQCSSFYSHLVQTRKMQEDDPVSSLPLSLKTHTQTLSLSLKHRQNALLSEVLEKHPKIQNQIQASSLQV